MYKKILSIFLLGILCINLTACDEDVKYEYIVGDEQVVESQTFTLEDDLTYQERYDKVIENMKKLNSYYVVLNVAGKGNYFTYNTSNEYIWDNNNQIYEIVNAFFDYSEYMDFDDDRHIYYDFVCYNDFIYQEIAEGKSMNNVNIFLIPMRTTSEDIISYEDGTYTIKIEYTRFNDIQSNVKNDLELKITINNDYYIKNMEYIINDDMDTVYTYTYSKYDKIISIIDEEATEAIYYPLGSDCPIVKNEN